MRLRGRLALLVLALATGGCASHAYLSAAERTRPTNPHAALEYARLCLANDPTNEGAIDLVRDLGTRIADEHRDRVQALAASHAYEDAVAQCDRVIASAKVVADMPGNIQIPHDPDERTRFATLAARKFYEQGMKLEGEGQTKLAAIAYRRAFGFRPNFEDSVARYQRTQAGATTQVAILPFESLVPAAQPLAPVLTNGVLAAVVQQNPEFLHVVDASHAQDPTVGGRLKGSIESGNFRDSGWLPHPGKNVVVKQVPDQNGIYWDRRFEATWTVYGRETTYDLTASYSVTNAKSGVVMAASRQAATAQDAVLYLGDVNGDQEALPDNVARLPRRPLEPKNESQLSSEAVSKLAQALGTQLVSQFQ